ncbi:hypothetical protein BR93DRAFT_241397 [Coniochaeta sp. PMI_546]|nr:hypothetical protein BR93DRAFT_241397 [Coniochaeta sp. PMI_546]
MQAVCASPYVCASQVVLLDWSRLQGGPTAHDGPRSTMPLDGVKPCLHCDNLTRRRKPRPDLKCASLHEPCHRGPTGW